MKDRSEIGIVEATARYEAWLAERIPPVKADLELKHRAMSAGVFPFFRAAFYRRAARWRALAGEAPGGPAGPAVRRRPAGARRSRRDAHGVSRGGVRDSA